MGQRELNLHNLLIKEFGLGRFEKPKPEFFLTSSYHNEILRVYRSLGGIMTEYPTRFGKYDICTSQFIIELDEERHFNRYRLLTLASPIYGDVTTFSVKLYSELCLYNEIDCVKSACWGKNWNNNSTDKQFGKSNTPGNFAGNGSSRWKQRAFYDFLKDITSLISGFPIIRVSVFEKIDKDLTVGKALTDNLKVAKAYIIDAMINKGLSSST